MILKTDLVPNFESSVYSGWDPGLIRVGASTLNLASLKVYSVTVCVIGFCVIIFSGLIFYIFALCVADASGIFQNLTICYL